MLEKFYTDEIEERLLKKDIKKIGSFIYSWEKKLAIHTEKQL